MKWFQLYFQEAVSETSEEMGAEEDEGENSCDMIEDISIKKRFYQDDGKLSSY